MEMKMNVSYKEVSFDGMTADRNYKNPMTNIYQYEYALYTVVSELFQTVRCKSLCPGSLMLYFKELPRGVKEEESADEKGTPKKSQKKILEEMERMVERDVIGYITFPMISICAAEVMTRLEEDGTHSFIFTDGVYAFSIHLDMQRKGHPKGIEVRDMPVIKPSVD